MNNSNKGIENYISYRKVTFLLKMKLLINFNIILFM